jgi:ribosome-binding protein aMBF1 (putative translation factor)
MPEVYHVDRSMSIDMGKIIRHTDGAREEDYVDTKSLGTVVRKRRVELGLTQEELGQQIDPPMTQADVSRLEAGKVRLPRPMPIRR